MTRRALVPALVTLCLLVSGCFLGYQPVRYKDALADTRTVAIVPLTNESYEPGAETIVSDAIIREFERRGSLRVVPQKDNADLVIGGKVDEVLIQARSFSSIQFALEFSLTLRLDVKIERADGTEVAFDRRALADTDLFFASADIEATRKNREEALRRVSGLLAARLHDALFERTVP